MMTEHVFYNTLRGIAIDYLRSQEGWDVDFIVTKSFRLGVEYDIATHSDGVVLEFCFYAMDKEHPVQTSMPITLEVLKELFCDH